MSDQQLLHGALEAMNELYVNNNPFMEHEQHAYNYIRLLRKRLLEGSVVRVYTIEDFEMGLFLNLEEFINRFKEKHPQIISFSIDESQKRIGFKTSFKYNNEYVFYYDEYKLNIINDNTF